MANEIDAAEMAALLYMLESQHNDVLIQKHIHLPGYAVTIIPDADVEQPIVPGDLPWRRAGHGRTIGEAIREAVALYDGRLQSPTPVDYFTALAAGRTPDTEPALPGETVRERVIDLEATHVQ